MVVTEAPSRPASFELWDQQIAAMRLILEDGVNQLLYGGAAGGGKSEFIRALAYHFAQMWPGARIPIFRLTYPELEESHLEQWLTKMAELGWDNTKCWQATPKQYRFSHHTDPSVPCPNSLVEFRHIDQKLGAKKWLSAEWAALLIDEAVLFEPADLRLLYSRVRRPKEAAAAEWEGWKPHAVYATNPDGPAHSYLKETFIDPSTEHDGPWDADIELPSGRKVPIRRAFLRSMLDDNPSIDPDEYVAQLGDLPEAHRKRYLEGDWSYFEGAAFPQLNRETHQVDAEWVFGKGYPCPPRDWPRMAGMDHGITSAAEWITRTRDGFFVVYQEHYAKGPVGQHIDAIKDLMERDGHPQLRPVADPQMFRKNRGHDHVYSVAEEYAWNGPPQTHGTPEGILLQKRFVERETGRLVIQRLLDPDQSRMFPDWHPRRGEYGAPGIFIAKQCPQLWREMQNIRYKDGASEDTVKEDDHAFDALWHALPVFEREVALRNRGTGPRRVIEARSR